MRKRSKKRIPQETLPWVRVSPEHNAEAVSLFTKISSRGVCINRRYVQTSLFSYGAMLEKQQIISKSFLTDQLITPFAACSLMKLQKINSSLDPALGAAKPKNFCLLMGRGRTFSRKLFISRQAVRKLVKTGLISGLRK